MSVLKKTDYLMVFQTKDPDNITFAGSSRKFHQEVRGISLAAADEGAQGVAAGRAWGTVVLLACTLIVICSIQKAGQETLVGT